MPRGMFRFHFRKNFCWVNFIRQRRQRRLLEPVTQLSKLWFGKNFRILTSIVIFVVAAVVVVSVVLVSVVVVSVVVVSVVVVSIVIAVVAKVPAWVGGRTYFLNGPLPASFSVIFVFSTVNSEYVHFKILPTGFELRTFGIGSNHSVSWPTTTFPVWTSRT